MLYNQTKTQITNLAAVTGEKQKKKGKFAVDDAEATRNFNKVKGSTQNPNTGFTRCFELNMAEVEEPPPLD